MFKVKNLAKASFFKLLTKQNLLECFHISLQLDQKQRRISARQNFVEKNTCKQRGFFDQRNYTKINTWKQCKFFDHRNYVEKSAWKRRGFLDLPYNSEKSTWKWHRFFDQRNYIKKVRRNVVEIRLNLVLDIST